MTTETNIKDCIVELNLTISELHKKLTKNQEKFQQIDAAIENIEQAVGKLFFMQKVTFNNMRIFAIKIGISAEEISEKDLDDAPDIDNLKNSIFAHIKKVMGV